MAFNKYAHAKLVQPVANKASWDEVRASAQRLGSAFGERQARTIFSQFDPREFMLSHCTIIASVDVEDTGAKTGRQIVDGYEVNRLYSDYQIRADTEKYANNNHDAWERQLLLASFPTFVGGENYVEHLQIPEMSKGKIVDAVARDIGDSIYVDILVATNRKHRPLIAAIENQQLQTLSMGCTVEFTICSRCGNVAYDETQLCPHVRYFKGNKYVDARGIQRRVVELCGHIRAEPGSVKFIEASWVANPAFAGAVLRNILSEEEVAMLGDRIQVAFSMPSRQADEGLMAKAARMTRGFTFGDDDEDPEGAPSEGGGDEDPIKDTVKNLKKHVLDQVMREIKKDLSPDEAPSVNVDPRHSEQTIVKEAAKSPYWRRVASQVLGHLKDPAAARKVLVGLVLHHRNGWEAVREQGFTGREILAVSRFVDLLQGRPNQTGDTRVYRTILAVGGVKPYGDLDSYLAACRRIVGRDLHPGEVDALVSKGKLFDLATTPL